MTALWTEARLSYRAQYHWTGFQGFVSNVVLRAPLTLAIYAFVSRAALDEPSTRRSIVGMVLYGIPTTVIGGVAQMFSHDREDGVLAVTVLAARSRLRLFAARGLWHLPNALVAVATGLVFAWVVLDTELGDADWFAVASCSVVVAVSVVAYALLAGNLALVLREYIAAMTLSSGVLLVCSGVVIPSERLPRVVEWLANGLPLTHGLRGFRSALDGATPSVVASDLGWELIVGAGYLVVGAAVFGWICDRSRSTGALELTEA